MARKCLKFANGKVLPNNLDGMDCQEVGKKNCHFFAFRNLGVGIDSWTNSFTNCTSTINGISSSTSWKSVTRFTKTNE